MFVERNHLAIGWSGTFAATLYEPVYVNRERSYQHQNQRENKSPHEPHQYLRVCRLALWNAAFEYSFLCNLIFDPRHPPKTF